MSTSAGTGSPASLIAEARAGSPDALSALYLKHGAALFRLAYRLVGAREDAEDVVHDVFVGLPEALGRYEERGSFVAWLKRVTARVALMRLRSGKRRREVTLDDAAAQSEPGMGSERDGLEAAVNTLPDHLRAVLVLKEIEGYAHAEIAELLGISEGASRVRLTRALKRLRNELESGR
jgi:RNA polymerase sigma-70 factor (ECF subfamily)